MSTVKEEIDEIKAAIRVLQIKIEAAETGGRSEPYIISLRSELVNLGQQLVGLRSELVELRKKENILLKQRTGKLLI